MKPEVMAFLIIVMGFAVYHDVRMRRIPNLITFPSMVLALAYHSITGGMEGFLFSIQGLGLGMGLMFVPYLLGVLGAGDAKLMAVVGAALGAKDVFGALILTSIIGGVYAVGVLLFSKGEVSGMFERLKLGFTSFLLTRRLPPASEQEGSGPKSLCYGVAIGLGTLAIVFIRAMDVNFLL